MAYLTVYFADILLKVVSFTIWDLYRISGKEIIPLAKNSNSLYTSSTSAYFQLEKLYLMEKHEAYVQLTFISFQKVLLASKSKSLFIPRQRITPNYRIENFIPIILW